MESPLSLVEVEEGGERYLYLSVGVAFEASDVDWVSWGEVVNREVNSGGGDWGEEGDWGEGENLKGWEAHDHASWGL